MSVLPGSVNEEDRDDDLDAALETVPDMVSSLQLEHNQRQWCRNGLHSDRFIYRISISCYLCGGSFRRPRDLSDHVRVRHLKLPMWVWPEL